jgi:ferrous iron transport protein B
MKSGESKIEATQKIIALAGNPNTGKTTLFNALTGLRHKVANYSGVTVERKEGVWKTENEEFRLIDLPGLYSLEATSLDEEIAHNVLVGKSTDITKPDVIIAVVDATNLERNLYLVTQLYEYKIPIVVVLTMMDLLEKKQISIDTEKLSKLLNLPIIPINLRQKTGLDELTKAVADAKSAEIPFTLNTESDNSKIFSRYNFISEVVQESIKQNDSETNYTSEKIDRILTHKVFGLFILTAILLVVFQTIFSFAELPMNLLEGTFSSIGDFVKSQMSEGLLADLIVDGIIAGVGGVLVFLPQILLLFFFISLLEDSGYMARAAFLLDRLMRGVGLHGKAFLPLMSSFACAIPGIMATRTIENPKDRLATILIAPFMSCSARLPVYALMIATFFAGQTVLGFISLGAVLMLAMYLLGIIIAIAVAWILKRTLLKSPPPPLIMELPPYRLPNIKTVLINMFDSGWIFVKRTGTVILAISIILWGLTTFPKIDEAELSKMIQTEQACECPETAKKLEDERVSLALKNSYAGQLGHLIEPVIRPLGFDWKIGVALIASFAAREVLVSTLSIIYNVGKDENEESEKLATAIKEAKNDDGTLTWSPLTALTLMVFFVLAIQCMSTVAVVRRETNSWMWTIFMVVYMTGLAYIASFIIYQTGKMLGF